ncbi:MAG: toxin [Methanococcaceae archaeon]
MANKDEIESFLNEMRAKLSVYPIFFYNREKNKQALLDLEITPLQRDEFIQRLTVEDYFDGPTPDTIDNTLPDYWEFGITVKGKEVYIKISMGRANRNVICMSFHLAERKITYPYKNK